MEVTKTTTTSEVYRTRETRAETWPMSAVRINTPGIGFYFDGRGTSLTLTSKQAEELLAVLQAALAKEGEK